MLRAFSAGLLAASASAQAWGTSGSWQTIAPTTSVTGPGGFAARPVSVGGNVVWLGNNTATGLQALWSFDAARRAWSKWPDLPAAFQPTQPFILASGGFVIVMDEPNPNAMMAIDSAAATAPGAAWTSLPVSGAPLNRYGQRLIDWAGVLYSFGGFENSTSVAAGFQHNDLYALDLLAVVRGVTNVVWTQVSADAQPGFPLARAGASFTAFNVAAVLFGGAFSLNPADQDPYDVCFPPWSPNGPPPPPPTQCLLLDETWLFLPGNTAPTPGSVTSNQWIRMQTSGFNGGATPAGRFQHSAGYMGDQLWVPSRPLNPFSYRAQPPTHPSRNPTRTSYLLEPLPEPLRQTLRHQIHFWRHHALAPWCALPHHLLDGAVGAQPHDLLVGAGGADDALARARRRLVQHGPRPGAHVLHLRGQPRR